MNSVIVAGGLRYSYLVVLDDIDLLTGGLILHSIVCLGNDVIKIEEIFVEFEIHCLEFGQVKKVVY